MMIGKRLQGLLNARTLGICIFCMGVLALQWTQVFINQLQDGWYGLALGMFGAGAISAFAFMGIVFYVVGKTKEQGR